MDIQNSRKRNVPKLAGIFALVLAHSAPAAPAAPAGAPVRASEKEQVTFTVKTPDGREEMRLICNEEEKSTDILCDIHSTKFVVPDLDAHTNIYNWSQQLAAGDDSVFHLLCKDLKTIDPRVKETREIVTMLKSGCGNADKKTLSLAYAKMDSLSKSTCIIVQRNEDARFSKSEKGVWVHQAAKPNACLDSKRYVVRTDPVSGYRTLEKALAFSDSKFVACAEERYIEKSGTLKQLTDAHIEIPPQCRYLYLQ